MTLWWRSRSHPTVGLLVAAIGLLIAFWSMWPWAQRPNDPTQSVSAGHVSDQRTQVLVLGLAITAIGVTVYCSALRLLLVGSAIAAMASLVVARGVIGDVSAITADDSELVSEVGWALYWIEVAAFAVVVASVVGLSRRRERDRASLPD